MTERGVVFNSIRQTVEQRLAANQSSPNTKNRVCRTDWANLTAAGIRANQPLTFPRLPDRSKRQGLVDPSRFGGPIAGASDAVHKMLK